MLLIRIEFELRLFFIILLILLFLILLIGWINLFDKFIKFIVVGVILLLNIDFLFKFFFLFCEKLVLVYIGVLLNKDLLYFKFEEIRFG